MLIIPNLISGEDSLGIENKEKVPTTIIRARNKKLVLRFFIQKWKKLFIIIFYF